MSTYRWKCGLERRRSGLPAPAPHWPCLCAREHVARERCPWYLIHVQQRVWQLGKPCFPELWLRQMQQHEFDGNVANCWLALCTRHINRYVTFQLMTWCRFNLLTLPQPIAVRSETPNVKVIPQPITSRSCQNACILPVSVTRSSAVLFSTSLGFSSAALMSAPACRASNDATWVDVWVGKISNAAPTRIIFHHHHWLVDFVLNWSKDGTSVLMYLFWWDCRKQHMAAD